MYRKAFPCRIHIIVASFVDLNYECFIDFRLVNIFNINNSTSHGCNMLYRVGSGTSFNIRQNYPVSCTLLDRKRGLSVAVGGILVRVTAVVDIYIQYKSFNALAFHVGNTVNCNVLVAVSKVDTLFLSCASDYCQDITVKSCIHLLRSFGSGVAVSRCVLRLGLGESGFTCSIGSLLGCSITIRLGLGKSGFTLLFSIDS